MKFVSVFSHGSTSTVGLSLLSLEEAGQGLEHWLLDLLGAGGKRDFRDGLAAVWPRPNKRRLSERRHQGPLRRSCGRGRGIGYGVRIRAMFDHDQEYSLDVSLSL